MCLENTTEDNSACFLHNFVFGDSQKIQEPDECVLSIFKSSLVSPKEVQSGQQKDQAAEF